MDSIRTIYFDVGGTILRANPSVGAIYADAVARLGHEVDADRVNANFSRAWKRSLTRRAASGHVCDDALLREDWLRIVLDSFAGLVPDTAAREAFDDLYERFSRSDAWRLADGAVETFEELARRGYRLGVLSNWDGRFEETLASVGILDYFELRVVSYRVGVEKPHPRIFREALDRAGARAGEVLHIGDSLEWDIRPARALGMRALWVTGGPLTGSPNDGESFDSVDSIAGVLPYVLGS